MTDQQGRNSAAMTAAEFRIARERLGVTIDWLAARLGVDERAVRRWESGARPISPARAAGMAALGEEMAEFVAAVVAQVRSEPPDPDGTRWVIAYANDSDYASEHPDSPWTAGWHRAAMGRVADELPGVRIYYRDHQGGPPPPPT